MSGLHLIIRAAPAFIKNPQGFLGAEWGLQSTAQSMGSGESWEERERGMGEGHTESGDWGPQDHNRCSSAQALFLRISLALGQSATRQPLGIQMDLQIF